MVEAAVAYLHQLGFVGQGGGVDDAHNQAYSGRWQHYPHPGCVIAGAPQVSGPLDHAAKLRLRGAATRKAKPRYCGAPGELGDIAQSVMADAQAVVRNARRSLRTTGEHARPAAPCARSTWIRCWNAPSTWSNEAPRSAGRGDARFSYPVVDYHDVDARPIRKGRLGKPVEFGYNAQVVVDNADGVILDHIVVMETLPMHRNWRRRSRVSPSGPALYPSGDR